MAWINWLTCKDRIWQKWRNVISKIKVIKRLGLLYWGLAFSHPLSEFLTLEKASCHVMRWLYAEVHVIGSETLTVSDTKKESEVAQSCPTLHNPMDCSLPGSSIHGIFQARVLEWVAICFSRWFSNPGIEPRSPTLQVDALPFEPPGKRIRHKWVTIIWQKWVWNWVSPTSTQLKLRKRPQFWPTATSSEILSQIQPAKLCLGSWYSC